jgi:hypothetical protein
MHIRTRLYVWLALIGASLAIGAGASFAPAPSGQPPVVAAGIGVQRVLMAASQYAPSWQWDARSGALPAGATFTRASGRSCVNSSGLIVQLANDVPCFYYDPSNPGTPWGWLGEQQSTNTIANSTDLTGWGGNLVQALNFTVAPDGTTTAAKHTEHAALTNSLYYRYVSTSWTSGNLSGLSMFFKAGTRGYAFVSMSTDTPQNCAGAVVDIASGAVTETRVGSSSGTVVFTTVQRFPNGWVRVGLAAKVTGAGTKYIEWGIAGQATGNTWSTFCEAASTGDGTGYLYAWGYQFETTQVGISSYIPTSGSGATRSQDVLTMPITAVRGWNGTRGAAMAAAGRRMTNSDTTDSYAFNLNPGSLSVNEVSHRFGFVSTDTRWGGVMTSGGVGQFNLASTSLRPGLFVRSKQALGWSTTAGTEAQNGVLETAANVTGSYSLPVGLTTLDIGRRGGGAFNGVLESLAFYPGPRSAAFIQQVSK